MRVTRSKTVTFDSSRIKAGDLLKILDGSDPEAEVSIEYSPGDRFYNAESFSITVTEVDAM